MKFTFITIFKEAIECYFDYSIIKKGIEKKLIEVEFLNPFDFTKDKHQKIDKPPIGGGAGMVMLAQPLQDAIKSVKNRYSKVIYVTPAGKKFNQKDAKRLSAFSHIVFICGRYEGIDERVVEKEVDEVYGIGDFVLSGGELPALCIMDAISRNIKGVLGNEESLKEESFEKNLIEAPAFAKPVELNGNFVPLEFLKGNHSKITALKTQMALYRTMYYRPDILKD
jgi:tRNA (guanine37-N1)-methyltransferase